jgi:SAM-dependent methyltransferase
MEAGGMVHALEEIHRLLRPTGTLIEIHPVHGAWVEIRVDADVRFVEPDPGFDSDAELRPTERAVRTVVEARLFALDQEREFDFLTYAASVRELREHFAMVGGYDEGPAPSVTRRRDELYGRAEEVRVASGAGAEVVYREQAKISRLLPAA